MKFLRNLLEYDGDMKTFRVSTTLKHTGEPQDIVDHIETDSPYKAAQMFAEEYMPGYEFSKLSRLPPKHRNGKLWSFWKTEAVNQEERFGAVIWIGAQVGS